MLAIELEALPTTPRVRVTRGPLDIVDTDLDVVGRKDCTAEGGREMAARL